MKRLLPLFVLVSSVTLDGMQGGTRGIEMKGSIFGQERNRDCRESFKRCIQTQSQSVKKRKTEQNQSNALRPSER